MQIVSILMALTTLIMMDGIKTAMAMYASQNLMDSLEFMQFRLNLIKKWLQTKP